jgi:hypothetical protein
MKKNMAKFNNDLVKLTEFNIVYYSVGMDVERINGTNYKMNAKYPDRITKKVSGLPKYADIKHTTNYNKNLNGSVIFLGENYNLIGIDIDNKDDTLIKYNDICIKNNFDRKTLRTITPNNGYHEYYKLSKLQKEALRNFNSLTGGPFGLNIDIKYNNQYFYGPSLFGDKKEFSYKIDIMKQPIILPDFIFNEILKQYQVKNKENKKESIKNNNTKINNNNTQTDNTLSNNNNNTQTDDILSNNNNNTQTDDILSNNNVNIVQDYVNLLNDIRADDYNQWIQLGWCLHNIDESLVDVWVEFSKKSIKFEDGECNKLWNKMKHDGFNMGTLKYWAKMDNPDKYRELNKTHSDFKFSNTDDFNSSYFSTLDGYHLQKKYFELFCSKVMRPAPIYVYSEINYEKGVIETFYYPERKLTETFNHLPCNFINKWIKDKDIKVYNNLIFKPFNGVKYEPINMNTFNTFTGYNPHIKTQVTDNTIIKDWCDVVLQLCEGNKTFYDYYIKYLAHIIQFPSTRIGISILFRSNEGVGKGQHLIAIKNIITKKYYFASPTKDDFTGKHALAFANTLLVNWDETGSCADVIDQIKSKITEEYVVIERKNIDKAEFVNYARIIFTTNNMCSLPISDSNRRFVIFQCTDHFINVGKIDNTFWDRFHETIYKPEFIAALYNYLNNIDLNNWDYKDFPKTTAYNQMKSLYIPSEMLFLIDTIVKVKKDVKIKGTKLFEDYSTFVNANNLNQKHTVNVKEFYAKMDNFKNSGINGIDRVTITGGVIGYSFNYDTIIKCLIDKKYIDDPQKCLFVDETK